MNEKEKIQFFRIKKQVGDEIDDILHYILKI